MQTGHQCGETSKNKRPFSDSYLRPNTQTKPFATPKFETVLKEDKRKDKGRVIVNKFPKKLDGKRCFKCQSYGHL